MRSFARITRRTTSRSPAACPRTESESSRCSIKRSPATSRFVRNGHEGSEHRSHLHAPPQWPYGSTARSKSMRKLGVALAILVTLLFALSSISCPARPWPGSREPTSSEWTRRTWRVAKARRATFASSMRPSSTRKRRGSFETRIPPVISNGTRVTSPPKRRSWRPPKGRKSRS